MKAKGVDFSSKNKLIELAKEGYTAEEISSMIQVEEESVKSWMKYLKLGEKKVTKESVKKAVKKVVKKVAKKDKTEED